MDYRIDNIQSIYIYIEMDIFIDDIYYLLIFRKEEIYNVQTVCITENPG